MACEWCGKPGYFEGDICDEGIAEQEVEYEKGFELQEEEENK